MLTINFKRFILAFIITVAVVLGITIFKPIVQAQISVNLPEKAKAEVVRTTGIPANDLTIGNQTTLAGTNIKQFKIIDSQNNVYFASLDAAGNPVSKEVLNRAIEAFHSKGWVGKMEVALDNILKQGLNESIQVIIWLKEEPTAPSRGRTPDERLANLNKLRVRYTAIEQPIVDKLKLLGQKVTFQSSIAPVIGATVTPSLIHTIAAHPDVKRISLDHKKGSSRLNVSRNVVQANTVNSRGLTGLYETVGIVEEFIMGDHPNLPSAQRTACNLQDLTILNGQILTGVHKNLVAGIIQSTNASYRGITPDINIVDGVVARNYPTTSIMAATECVINNSVGVINMSFFEEETNGDFNEFARYVDKVVYETGVNIVVAASNLCENRPGSPDISFNIINVGSFGDNNTTSFADDIVPCTNGIVGSYLNPNTMHMDREEPDVVAPGVNIKSTNKQGGFEDANGTSFAAPHVTSAVALLIQRKPALYFNPAEVRSVIMASARHNIEGNSRLSDRDGAGGVMLAAADTVVSSGLSDYIINDGSAPNFPISKTFTASSGQKVRVAIAWDHKMPYGERLSVPTSDLDLRVFCGSTLVSSSLSFDNNYEIVEFTAGSCPSGYTAKIIGVSLSVGDEHIGFAVSKTDT